VVEKHLPPHSMQLHEAPGIHISSVCVCVCICVCVCVCVRLLQHCCWALRFPGQLGLTAPSGYRRSPKPSSASFLLSFSLFFALLHLLRLPLFHALSSHNTVGVYVKFLEFLRAPLSGICPLFSAGGKFPSPYSGITWCVGGGPVSL